MSALSSLDFFIDEEVRRRDQDRKARQEAGDNRDPLDRWIDNEVAGVVEANQARHASDVDRLRNKGAQSGNEVGGLVTGVQAAGASLTAPIARHVFQNDQAADALQGYSKALLEAQQSNVQERVASGEMGDTPVLGEVRQSLNRALPSVANSVTQMGVGAATGLGSVGMAGTFAASEADSKYHEARQLMQSKEDATGTAVRSGLAEGGVMLAFQGLGKMMPALAGAEGMLTNPASYKMFSEGMRQAAKQASVRLGAELVEENTTSILQAMNDAASLPGSEDAANWTGEDGTFFTSPIWETMKQTTETTMWQMGLSDTVAQLNPENLKKVKDFVRNPSRRKLAAVPEQVQKPLKNEYGADRQAAADVLRGIVPSDEIASGQAEGGTDEAEVSEPATPAADATVATPEAPGTTTESPEGAMPPEATSEPLRVPPAPAETSPPGVAPPVSQSELVEDSGFIDDQVRRDLESQFSVDPVMGMAGMSVEEMQEQKNNLLQTADENGELDQETLDRIQMLDQGMFDAEQSAQETAPKAPEPVKRPRHARPKQPISLLQAVRQLGGINGTKAGKGGERQNIREDFKEFGLLSALQSTTKEPGKLDLEQMADELTSQGYWRPSDETMTPGDELLQAMKAGGLTYEGIDNQVAEDITAREAELADAPVPELPEITPEEFEAEKESGFAQDDAEGDASFDFGQKTGIPGEQAELFNPDPQGKLFNVSNKKPPRTAAAPAPSAMEQAEDQRLADGKESLPGQQELPSTNKFVEPQTSLSPEEELSAKPRAELNAMAEELNLKPKGKKTEKVVNDILIERQARKPTPRGEQRYKEWMDRRHKNGDKPMSYLSGHSSEVVREEAKNNPGIGLLITPHTKQYLGHADDYSHIALDNGVFSEFTGTAPFSDEKFRGLITEAAEAGLQDKTQFVVAPDVVGDWQGTIERSAPYFDFIREQGFSPAFAAQDGIEDNMDQIPWDNFDVLFIGGSTPWKLGYDPKGQYKDFMRPTDAELSKAGALPNHRKLFEEAKKRGKRIHIGRVNSNKRIELGNYGMQAETADGNYIGKAPDKNLPDVVNWLGKTGGDQFQAQADPATVSPETVPESSSIEAAAPASSSLTYQQLATLPQKQLEAAAAEAGVNVKGKSPRGIAKAIIEARKTPKEPEAPVDEVVSLYDNNRRYLKAGGPIAAKPNQRVAQTDDGFVFFEQEDGTWADQPNADDADLAYDTFEGLGEYGGHMLHPAHEMTADEYVTSRLSIDDIDESTAAAMAFLKDDEIQDQARPDDPAQYYRDNHAKLVQRANDRGEKIPDSVRAEYPDLIQPVAESEDTSGQELSEIVPEPGRNYGTLKEPSRTELSKWFESELSQGQSYPNINKARQEAGDLLGGKITKAHKARKDVDEAIELGIVNIQRKASMRAPAIGKSREQLFDDMVDLHERQPRLGTATSTSLQEQAFSTPAPLANAVNWMIGTNSQTTVYDSSAGNGMLLSGVPAKNATANEINPDRVEGLRSQGIETNQGDATQYRPDKQFDAVIINPPFGKVQDENGVTQEYEVDGVKTKEVDHAITLNSLPAMKDDGRAIVLMGTKGVRKEGNAKKSAYLNGGGKAYYTHIYDNYNVTDHFVVDGSLYNKMGAGFPVDVLVIDGKGKSNRGYPWQEAPVDLKTWEDVKNAAISVADKRSQTGVESTGNQQPVGSDTSTAGPEGNNLGGVPNSTSDASGVDGVTDPESGASVPGPVVGEDGQSADQPVAESGSDDGGRGRPAESGSQSESGSVPVASDAEQAGSGDSGRDDGPDGPDGGTDSLTDEDRAALDAEMAAEFGEPVAEKKPKRKKAAKRKKSTRRKKAKAKAEAADQDLKEDFDEFRDALKDIGFASGAPLDPRLVKATVKLTKSLVNKGIAEFNLYVQTVADQLGDELTAKLTPALEYVWSELPKYGYAIDATGKVRDVLAKRSESQRKPTKANESESEENSAKAQKGATPEQQADVPDAEFQTSYAPGSKMNSGGTLVPKNLEKSTRNALESIAERRGDIDKFVMDELDYTPEELKKNFLAEQVDALALAIDNQKNGAGFIIGDQTGVGKGRVVAGMIRYARRNGMVPVFITEKPSLFSDMMRDLMAVGESTSEKPFNILTTNSVNGDNVVDLPDGRKLTGTGATNLKRFTDAVKSHAAGNGLASKVRGKPVNYDALFMTYSQFQSVKGEESKRHGPLRELASDAYFILDEAHNAGGSEKGRPGREDQDDEDGPISRADFIRELLSDSPGVFYSSATFAKRPSVMDLYMATDMAKAVEGDISKLPDAVALGGLPLQQSLSAMLAEAGQYIRRERSFDGVEFAADVVDVDTVELDNIASSLRSVQEMYDSIDMDAIQEVALSGGYQLHNDVSIGTAGTESTEFHSVLWNLVDQMLLSLKADVVADQAIAALKKGEKPVIALSGTMESQIKQLLDRDNLKEGDLVNWTFKDLLLKYLDRSREVRIKDPETKKVVDVVYIKDEDIGEEALEKYNAAKQLINGLNITAPISPIDMIRKKISDAGFNVREVTGRNYTLDYNDDGTATISKKPDDERGNAGKIKSIDGFNDGSTDVLIVNRSGSTGLSLHASQDFIDQRRRRMIVAQAAGNIDEFMQMLGRIHRTGQVTKPAYTMLMTSAPAENRPAAVTVKKLASLNANVTGASKGKVSFDAPDIINTIGDQVVADWYMDNLELWQDLGNPLRVIRSGGENKLDSKDAAKKVSGRVAILPVAEQKRFWEEVSTTFNETIDSLNEAGANPLSVKAMDLQAETKSSLEIFDGNREGNSFEQPANLEKMSVLQTVNVMTHADINKELSAFYGTEVDGVKDNVFKHSSKWYTETANEIREEGKKILEKRLEGAKDDKAKDKIRYNHGEQVALLLSNLATVLPGNQVVFEPGKEEGSGSDSTRDYANGVVLSLKKPKSGNILSLSNWRAKIALDSKARSITTSLTLREVTGTNFMVMTAFPAEPTKVTKREDRWMGTGNMLAAFSQLKDEKGRVVEYTDKDGDTNTGVLLPKGFKASKWKEKQPVSLGSLDVVKAYILDGGVAVDPGHNVAVRMYYGGSVLDVKARRARSRGGKYTTNKKLLKAAGKGREFISSGQWMQLEVEPENADAVIAEIMKVTPLQAEIRKAEAIQAGGTQGNLGFGTETGEKARQTRPKGRTGKATTAADKAAEERGPVSHTEIRKRIEKLFDVKFKAGRVAKQWNAAYLRHFIHENEEKRTIIPGIIRVMKRNLGDLGLLAHEVAHHVDETHMELRDTMTPETRKQLRSLDYVADRKDKTTAEQEGLAEFIRMWAMSPKSAMENRLFADVPLVVSHFEKWMDREPETANSLEQMKKMAELYYRQSPAQRAASQVKETDEEDRPFDETTGELVDSKRQAEMRKLEADWFDRFAILKEVDDAAVEAGYDMKGKSGAHALQMAFQFTAPQQAQQAVKLGVHTVGEGQSRIISEKSLAEEVARSGVKEGQDYSDAINWAYAVMTRFLHGKDPGYNSGLTIEDAEAIIEGTSKEDAARYRILHKALTQFNNDGLMMLVDAGVIAKSEAKAMINANPYYIPAMRVTDKKILKSNRGGMVDIQKPVRSRSKKGSDAPILDPFIASINRMQVLYQAAFDQQVHAQLADMADNTSGIGEMIHRVPPEDKVTKVNMGEILADKEVMEALQSMGINPDELQMNEDLANLAVSIFRKNMTGDRGQRVIRIMRDGKPQLYEVHPDLYEALEQTADALKGPVVGAFAKATNAVRTGAVGLNPIFAGMNIVRDWRVFQGRTRYTGPIESLYAPITGLFGYIGHMAGRNNEIVDLYREAGGLLATRFGKAADQAVEIREKMLGLSPAEKKKHYIRDISRGAVRLGHAAEGLVAVADIGPRIAEFAGVLKKHGYRVEKGKLVNKDGKHERPPRHILIEATNAAAEATVNFKRRGKISAQLSKFAPFFGASMASANKQFRLAKAAFKKNPSEGNRTRLWVANGTIAALTTLHWAMRHNDDDYEEQPDWLKYGYWTFTWDGKPVRRIPRGYEESIVPNLVEGILNQMDPTTQDGIKEAIWQSLTKVAPPHEVAGISGVLEVYANYDEFRDSPIETDSMKGNTKQYRSNAWTSEFSKWLSAYGGSQIFNLSPVQIDHLISKQTGGLGTRVVQGTEGLWEAGTGQGTEKLKRAARTTNPLSGFDITRDYSESREEMYARATLVEQLRNNAEKLGKPEDPKLKEENSRFNRVKAMARELYKEIEDETDRDVRFTVEKYMIGLNRWALGKTDLKRYPNPLKLNDLPEKVNAIVSDEITKSVIRSIIQTESKSEDYLQSIESAKAFLTSTGITSAQAGKLLSDHYKSEGLSKDRYTREQTILRRRRERGRLMRLLKGN